jgi:prefoldin alpha subunit
MEKPTEKELKELQACYAEMQAVDARMKMAGRQMAALDEQIEEIGSMAAAVLELAAVKKGTPIFVPVATGVFSRACFDGSEFLVNVGAGVAVPRSAEQVSLLLKEQQRRVVDAREELAKSLSELARHSEAAEQRLRKLVT